MVDYDAAVAAVQDPNADPIFLAKIAYENPEFGANVAVNPRAYPGLIRWLAEFGDDRARQTVAQLGYAIPDSPAGAHQQGEAAAARAADAAQAGVQAEAQAGTAQPDAVQTGTVQPGTAQPVTPQPDAVQPDAEPATAQPDQPGPSMQPVQIVREYQAAQSGHMAAQPATQPEPQSDSPFDSRPQPASYGEDAYVQPAANPYGFTATQAATTTDQMQMAEIARSAPELYADLATNPNLYPALVDWLAQLHDPAVDAALAARAQRR